MAFTLLSNHLSSLPKTLTLLSWNEWPLSLRCRWTAESCPEELALLCRSMHLLECFSNVQVRAFFTSLCVRLFARLERDRNVILLFTNTSNIGDADILTLLYLFLLCFAPFLCFYCQCNCLFVVAIVNMRSDNRLDLLQLLLYFLCCLGHPFIIKPKDDPEKTNICMKTVYSTFSDDFSCLKTHSYLKQF